MPGVEQAVLADRLRRAAEPVAEAARASSARWSVRVPLSVRLQGGASRITIAAGGAAAPQAKTMEGNTNGTPCAHPVYGHGPRIRGTLVGGRGHYRYVPPGWTWVKQPPRPFLLEAIETQQDTMTEIFAGIIDDWATELGYR